MGQLPIIMHDGRVHVFFMMSDIFRNFVVDLISIGALTGSGCRAVIKRDHLRVFQGKVCGYVRKTEGELVCA